MSDDVEESQWAALGPKKPYTVLVLFPPECKMRFVNFHGELRVMASSPKQAVFFAQHEAWVECEGDALGVAKTDFEAIAVFRYHLTNLLTE